MGKGIVAIVWGGPPRSYDAVIEEHLLRGIKGERLPGDLIERGRTFTPGLYSILNLLVDDYEIRCMSYDQVSNHAIDYGFFHVGSFVPSSVNFSLVAPAFKHCKKTFVWNDLNSFFLSHWGLVFLKEHKEDITGLMIWNPQRVHVVEKVTGIKTLFWFGTSSGMEEDFCWAAEGPTKKLLVVGGVNERGGFIASAFAEYHFPQGYDVIQRHVFTKSVDVLAGCINLYEPMEYHLWCKFIGDYEYLVDGTDFSCTGGRVGWDAFCSGRSFIGVKDRGYSSYLFEEISIESELRLDEWEDIGWQEAHRLAKDRLVTQEEIGAAWSQVL